MERTVYIDIYFAINFGMDLMCFFITSRLLEHRRNRVRSLVASTLGAIYACIALVVGIRGVWGAICDVFVCLAICAVAQKRRGEWRETARYATVYCAVSIVLGGVMTVIYSALGRLVVHNDTSGEAGKGGSFSVFVAIALVGGVISLWSGRWFRRRGTGRLEVEIRYGERKKHFWGFCDSGNMLRDPISGRGCIVCELDWLKGLLPERLCEFLRSGEVGRLGEGERARVHTISVETVSGGGLLWGVRVDEIRIGRQGEWRSVDAILVIGRTAGELILPAELWIGGDGDAVAKKLRKREAKGERYDT